MSEIFNRKYCFGIAAVLGLICSLSLCMSILSFYNVIADALAVVSGYFASFFCCIGFKNNNSKKKIMQGFFIGLFVFYIVILIDFTLLEDGFGRNINNVLSWNKEAFSKYIKESTNIVPFATIRLFIKGYINNKLTLSATVVNILGNFTALIPLPFFINLFSRKKQNGFKIFAFVLLCVLAIELLQLVLLTGACDIDDVILNTSGAMLFYFISNNSDVSKMMKKITFGVWRSQ